MNPSLFGIVLRMVGTVWLLLLVSQNASKYVTACLILIFFAIELLVYEMDKLRERVKELEDKA